MQELTDQVKKLNSRMDYMDRDLKALKQGKDGFRNQHEREPAKKWFGNRNADSKKGNWKDKPKTDSLNEQRPPPKGQ